MQRSVFVTNNDNAVESMFLDAGWQVSSVPEKADMLCFSGGADISPFLYGQRAQKCGFINLARDMEEVSIWKNASSTKPKVGICRGHQLGAVLSGGSLWQDCSGHSGYGVHKITRQDSRYEEPFEVNTLHHQMVKPSDDMIVLATAEESGYLWDGRTSSRILPSHKDYSEVEAVFSYSTNFVGVQWHPEYNHVTSRRLFFDFIDQFIHFEK